MNVSKDTKFLGIKAYLRFIVLHIRLSRRVHHDDEGSNDASTSQLGCPAELQELNKRFGQSRMSIGQQWTMRKQERLDKTLEPRGMAATNWRGSPCQDIGFASFRILPLGEGVKRRLHFILAVLQSNEILIQGSAAGLLYYSVDFKGLLMLLHRLSGFQMPPVLQNETLCH